MKPLYLVTALSLTIAAFFIGRTTVKEPAPPAPEPKAEKKLTAILTETQASEEAPVTPKADETIAPPPLGSRQDLPNAQRLSETLAAAVEAHDNLDELTKILQEWLRRDPDEVIAWLATGDQRGPVLKVIFALWSSENPTAAQQWLAASQDLDGYQDAAYGLTYGLVEANQPEAALDIALSIEDPSTRAKVWENAGAALYAINQDELRERLSNSDIPQNLQEIMLENWKEKLTNRSRRNAQNLSSVYASAVAAGAEFKGTTPQEIIAELKSGINGSHSFSTTIFQVPNLTPAEAEHALNHISLDESGQLNYSR